MDSVPAAEAERVVATCTWLEVEGVAMAALLRDQYGATISENQVVCLVEGYAALTPEERTTLFEAGLDPSGSSADAAGDLTDTVFGGCGVVPQAS